MTEASPAVSGPMARKTMSGSPLFTGKLDAIEWVRVISACGVVWFHVPGGPFKEYGYAGLVAFILISIVFQAAGAEKDPPNVYFIKKAGRILTPWSFWFLFYGVFNLAKGTDLFPNSAGWVSSVLTGPWVGLWFMPFILLVSLVVWLAVQPTKKQNSLAISAGFLLIGAMVLLLCPKAQGIWKGQEPWAQWVHASAAIPIGLSLYHAIKNQGLRRLVALAAILVVCEAACLYLVGTNRGLAISYGLAILLVCIGFSVPFQHSPLARRLGALCLGVYMVHAALISVLKRAPGLGDQPGLLCAGVIVLSFVGVLLARKNQLLAKVL